MIREQRSLRGLALAVLAFLMTSMVYAQSLTVSGTVTDTDKLPIPGVTVQVLGQSGLGTVTDLDGNFRLSNVPSQATLRVSYVGMQSQDIPLNGRTSLSIVLKEDTELLDEVVVTALGIKRSEKALSYNVQEIKSEELTTVKDANFMNSLNGKVAGLNINASSAGLGGATKVVMRGIKSIEGSNNALYVIDGVPMFSMTGTQGEGQYASAGSTEGIADLNPDDIASISVLTGASAAALYGSAAANGAILITTKKGQKGAVRLSYSMNMDWGKPMWLPEFQHRYGNNGQIDSWGTRLPEGREGFMVEDFFDTATNMTHSLSVSGGTDRNQTYLSASTTNANGLVPNNEYNRYNFSARNTTVLLDERLTLDFSANYVLQTHRNFVNQGEYMNPLVGAYLMPRGESNDQVRQFERYDLSRELYLTSWTYGNGDYSMQNPYWVAYRNLRDNKRERYMLSLNTTYDILRWSDVDVWNVSARVRTDATHGQATDKRYASTLETLDMKKNGYYGEAKTVERQTYADVLSTINKGFELGEHRLNLNATLGASIQDTRYDSSSVRGPLKDNGIPNYFTIFNIDQSAAKTHLEPRGWVEQTQSIFGSAELGWNSYLFLTLTGRNDWASQLANSPRTSFFYPSVGLSAVITEMLNEDGKASIRNILNYMKVRASYASVASPFQRGLTTPTYEMNLDSKSYDMVSHFPIGQLYPERTNSFEVGLSSRWFNGLWTLDATYYLTNTLNQTIFSKLPAGAGYTGIYIQSGNIRNQGLELATGLHFGKEGGVLFDTDFTLGYNKNEIMELAEGYVNPLTKQKESLDILERGSLPGVNFILRKGGTLGDIYGNSDFRRDADGNILVNKDGTVNSRELKGDDRIKLGSILPDFTFGWNNRLEYKGLSLGVMISGRVGGVAVSLTQAAMDHYGTSEDSALARDKGYVQDGNSLVAPKSYFSTRGKNRMAMYYTYDATNIRLQEVSIGYRLGRKYLGNIADASLSLYGRNLAFLYNKAPFDPEAVSSTGNYSQGVDYFMLPSQRTLGFSLKLNF